MKIVSWNVNGLRSISQKGFLSWFKKENPDLLCLQEIKAQKDQLPPELIHPPGYYSYFNCATKKGYSGVVVYTKQKPAQIEKTLGLKKFDQEGRILDLKYSSFRLINLYLPHGRRDQTELSYKLQVYQRLIQKLKRIKNQKIILIGDFNIAHTEFDLARPKDNQRNIMFTPQERNQLDQIVNLGFKDSFRLFNQKSGHYTWWPWRFDARQRNLGWRLDYALVSLKLTPQIKEASILSQIKGSDHCPIALKI